MDINAFNTLNILMDTVQDSCYSQHKDIHSTEFMVSYYSYSVVFWASVLMYVAMQFYLYAVY